MRVAARIAALLVALSLCACATALQNVPLKWRPTDDIKSQVFQISANTIQFSRFEDLRTNQQLIGENREAANPKLVTTKEDVSAFVTAQMRQLFERAGFKTVDNDGAVVISGELRQFYVDETDRYRANVLLRVVMRNRAGAIIWEGNVSGTDETFGRSYKLENYYQVLSNSVINATTALWRDRRFIQALATSR